MRFTAFIPSMLLAGVLAGITVSCSTQAPLRSQAKVSQADAERIALGKVPGGSIKATELEKEKGKLIWSIELGTAGTKEITEINIDALSGDIVAVEKENH
jgi:uncharacterized membrane protein YkoI